MHIDKDKKESDLKSKISLFTDPQSPKTNQEKKRHPTFTTPTKRCRVSSKFRLLSSEKNKQTDGLNTDKFLCPQSVKKSNFVNFNILLCQDDKEVSSNYQTPFGSNLGYDDREKLILEKINKDIRVSAFESEIKNGLFSKEIQYLEPIKSKITVWPKEKMQYRRNSYILQQMPPLFHLSNNSPSLPCSELLKECSLSQINSVSKPCNENMENSILCNSELYNNKEEESI